VYFACPFSLVPELHQQPDGWEFQEKSGWWRIRVRLLLTQVGPHRTAQEHAMHEQALAARVHTLLARTRMKGQGTGVGTGVDWYTPHPIFAARSCESSLLFVYVTYKGVGSLPPGLTYYTLR
jgi:hypothetical protein